MTHCQSCYMELKTPDQHGTEADGQASDTYCVHCYAKGAFTSTMTLEQAVEVNIPWWKSEDESDDVARERIMTVFPKLERWNV